MEENDTNFRSAGNSFWFVITMSQTLIMTDEVGSAIIQLSRRPGDNIDYYLHRIDFKGVE